MDIRVLLTKFTTCPIIFACLLHMFVLCIYIYTYTYIYIIPLDFLSKNELRHLCPLNPIQTQDFFFDGFKNELRHLCPLNRIQIF